MATPEPGRSGAAAHARAMIDLDYTGSPLIADHALNETGMPEPHPGQHYPDWTRFGGTSHHVLVFWARHGRREACMGGPPVGEVRGDLSQSRCQSLPRRRWNGRCGPDPTRRPNRLPVHLRRRRSDRRTRSDSGPDHRSRLEGKRVAVENYAQRCSGGLSRVEGDRCAIAVCAGARTERTTRNLGDPAVPEQGKWAPV